VHAFIEELTDEEAAVVAAAMKAVARYGMQAARHLRGDVYEVRATVDTRSFRILFSQEAKFILLSLSAFQKKTQKAPRHEIELAEKRLLDWRRRGQEPY
jgi:phage-related protein